MTYDYALDNVILSYPNHDNKELIMQRVIMPFFEEIYYDIINLPKIKVLFDDFQINRDDAKTEVVNYLLGKLDKFTLRYRNNQRCRAKNFFATIAKSVVITIIYRVHDVRRMERTSR